jgi:hypothetical protein
MDNNTHYSTEQLIDFLEGRLDSSSSFALTKHLESGCKVCNETFEIYKRMFSAIQTLHWKTPSPSAHKKVVLAYSEKYQAKTKTRLLPFFRPAFIALTVLALITFAFLFNLNPGVVYAGYLENVTGQVEMKDPTTGSWHTVTHGQSVPINASIRSLSESQATIRFPGGEHTLLGSESEVQLMALTQSQGLWEISLEQVSGQTDNHTAQKTGSFSVHTQTGVAHSNNAHFVLKIFTDGSAETRVLEGQVEIRTSTQNSIIHPGKSGHFPPIKSVELPLDENINIIEPTPNPIPELTATAELTLFPTITPTINLFKPQIPTPSFTPNLTIPTNGSENSINSEIDCSPGNSGGAGNSENANNSESACK